MVPYPRNQYFTGRDELLAEIRVKLVKGRLNMRRVALYGLVGVGKTQAALEYTYRHQGDYNSVLWISAVNQDAISSGFQRIARMAGISPNANSASKIIESVVSWLQNQTTSLLIFDNLENISVINDVVPLTSLPGHVVLVTRNPELSRSFLESIEVRPLQTFDATEFLIRRAGKQDIHHSFQRTTAFEIVKELAGLALAIEQAAAYIRDVNPDRYLATYQMVLGGIAKYWPCPSSVAATTLLLLEVVNEKHPNAAKLLQLFAFLNPDNISLAVLERGMKHDDEFQEIIGNPLLLENAVRELEQYSLIARATDRRRLTIHRAVQGVVQRQMSVAVMSEMWSAVITRCREALPIDIHTRHDYKLWQSYEDQVVVPLSMVPTTISLSNSEHLVEALIILGNLLKADGRLKGAEIMLDRAVGFCAIFLEEDHLLSKLAMEALVSTNLPTNAAVNPGDKSSRNMNISKKGERLDWKSMELYRRMFAARQAITGGNSGPTEYNMDSLGRICYESGRISDAIILYQKEVEAKRRNFGEEHSSTLATMEDLALAYCTLGKFKEAAELQETIVNAHKRNLGEDHLVTLTSMGNLALIYADQGQIEHARALQEKALETSRRVLGENHLSTIACKENLANTYRSCRVIGHGSHLESQRNIWETKIQENVQYLRLSLIQNRLMN
jgi:tetratricopeptide (TPR) repeat protein